MRINIIYAFPLLLFSALSFSFFSEDEIYIIRSITVDSLGACQGVSIQKDNIYLYGDRETGVIRKYKFINDSLVQEGKEIKLTIHDSDIINHPTGIAYHEKLPVFIGNSIRLNKEGTLWRAVIYCVNWKGLQKTGTLDGNLISTIDDDTCVQGTRPEYIRYKNKWLVATADYGNKNNEVRLYDPAKLVQASRSSEKNVCTGKFKCGPWVQNLFWMDKKGILVLIQNREEGRKWRFTFIDLEKSIEKGEQVIINTADVDRNDELEGFAYLNKDYTKGIAVTSSRKNNINIIKSK